MDKVYTVFVSFHAKDDKQAEEFVLDMQPSDWLEHLEQDKQKGKQWKKIETKLLNNLWNKNQKG